MRGSFVAALALGLISSLAISPAYADVGVPPVLNKSWTPNRVIPGGVVQIRFDIGNPGTAAALTGVSFDDVLPAGLTVGNIGATAIACGTVSATAPSTIHYTAGTIAANTPSVSSPCNFEINITSSTEGVFTNTTTVITSNEGGAGPTSTAILTVGNPPTISKAFGVASMSAGPSTTLTFTISNPNTTVSASGIAFTDTLPAGLVVAATPGLTNNCGGTATAVAGAGTISLSGATLAAGASCTVVANVRGTTAGVKNNSVQVTSSNLGNGNTSNTSITITPTADLAITKTDGVTTTAPGSTLTYTIVASNAGPSNAAGTTVADTLPASLTGATWTCVGAGGGTCTGAGAGNINDTVNLPVGATVTYTLSATVAAGTTGTLSNTATVTAAGGITDPNLANNSATDSDTVPVADLSITKTNGVTSTTPGAVLTYTIVASNAGPSNAPGTTVTDTLPASLTGATWTCVGAGGGTCTGAGAGNINDTVNLPVGASVTYTLTATVAAGTTGTLTNTATVTAAGGITDTNLANNSASDADPVTQPTPVPTLSEAGLWVLAVLMVWFTFGAHQRRKSRDLSA